MELPLMVCLRIFDVLICRMPEGCPWCKRFVMKRRYMVYVAWPKGFLNKASFFFMFRRRPTKARTQRVTHPPTHHPPSMFCTHETCILRRHLGRSALGIEHPRSVVISRNLALVKAAGGCSKSVVRDCRHGVTATSEPLASRWVGLDNVVFDRRWAVEFQH